MAKDIAILDLSNPETKKLVIERIKSAKGLFWFTFRKARNQRSTRQNAYWWAVIIPNLRAGLNEAWGSTMDDDDAHEFAKHQFLSTPVTDNYGEIRGNIVRSTTALDTKEFCKLVDTARDWAQKWLNTYIPLPNEHTEDWYYAKELPNDPIDADWELKDEQLALPDQSEAV